MGKQSKAKQRSNHQGAERAVRNTDIHDRKPMKPESSKTETSL